MPIQTQCTWCGKKINAGDSFAGKSVKCPGCGGVIKIPMESGPASAPSQAAPPAAPPSVGPPQQFGGQQPYGVQPPQFGPPPQQFGPPAQQFGPPAQQFGPPPQAPIGGVFHAQDMSGQGVGADPGNDRRPCPACGELIMRDAAKCRYCGETFDGSIRTGKRRKKDDEDMNGLDWFLAILCGGIGCIVAIVYMIQGKSKGGKMLGLTIAFSIGWNVISFIIQAMIEAGR